MDAHTRFYGDKIVKQSYAPGFVLPLVLKDVRLALAEAESAGAPRCHRSTWCETGIIWNPLRSYADLDWTALGLERDRLSLNRGAFPKRRESDSTCGLLIGGQLGWLEPILTCGVAGWLGL